MSSLAMVRGLSLLTVLFLLQIPAEAGVLIAHHAGASNPTNEGFDLSFGGNAQVGAVSGDFGLDAWSIDLNGGSDVAIYARHLTAEEQASAASAGWVMSLRLRMVDFPVTSPNSMIARFYTGTKLYSLHFAAQSDGDPIVSVEESVDSRFCTLDGAGSGYHNYKLVYDAGADTATLTVDGLQQMSGLKGRSLPSGPRFDWGGGQTVCHANWNEASLAIVPEPSCMLLLLCAGTALLTRCSCRATALSTC